MLGAVSFDADASAATTDSAGHGTHVASLACGAGNNGVGLAGAGLRCRMLILKSDFSDSSVAKAIVYAVDHGADAINMSFGTDPGVAPSQAVRDAVDYAFAHNVVMAAAAADTPIADQGYPADLLQPTGTGPDLAVDKGLSVTAADASDARASFAGQGSQISLAAYGAYDSSPAASGPPGIFGAFTAGPNELETGSIGLPPHPPCTCRTTFAGDSRYAYVQGTSMATPMVSATGALIRHLNPDLTAAEIVRLDQGDRAPPGRRVDRRPGLGDPRRGRRAEPRREHRPPRAGVAGQAAAGAHAPSPRSPCAGRRPTRPRPACARRASRASSCGARPTAGASSACSRRRARRAG